MNVLAVLGQAEGPMGLMGSLWNVIKLIRFSDAELAILAPKDPNTPEGIIDLAKLRKDDTQEFYLEDTDARSVRELLKGWQRFKAGDVEWYDPLMEELKAESVRARPQKPTNSEDEETSRDKDTDSRLPEVLI